MAEAKRELAIATDPTAYDNIGGAAIAVKYDTANDYIGNAGSHGTVFQTIRVTSFQQNANREVIIEESIDQVAASAVYGGTYSASGSFEAGFRPQSFQSSNLLMGIMGLQTVTSNNYKLSQIPATLALKVVDEQASTASIKGTTVIYRGVGITSFELNLNVKEYARCTINWIARQAEVYDVFYNSNTAISDEIAVFYNAVLNFGANKLLCKGMTLTLNRQMDQDYFYIGSEFLQGLYYNGLTDLGGTITLGAGDWTRIRTMIAGSGTDAMLDVGKTEFTGNTANAIPEGKLEVILMSTDGTTQVAKITVDSCKLTEASSSVQGRNQFEKTVNWKAVLNPAASKDFTVHIGA